MNIFLKILVVFDSSSPPSDFKSNSNVIEVAYIKTANQYNNLVKKKEIKGKYKLIVFLTSKHSLPFDWRLSKLGDRAFVTFIGIKQCDIPLICDYLETIGILSIKNSTNKNKSTLINNIIQHINNNTHDNTLSLLKVSKEFNISTSYLSKIFKMYCGIGFKEYLIRLRINKAKALLRRGASVTETCLNVGYGNLTHFSKIFRRYVGLNPSAFRNQTSSLVVYKEDNNYEV